MTSFVHDVVFFFQQLLANHVTDQFTISIHAIHSDFVSDRK